MDRYDEFSISYDKQENRISVSLKYNHAVIDLLLTNEEWEPVYERIISVISGVSSCQYIEVSKGGQTFSLQFIYSASLEAILMRLESPDFVLFNGNAYLSSLSTRAGVNVYSCPSWQT